MKKYSIKDSVFRDIFDALQFEIDVRKDKDQNNPALLFKRYREGLLIFKELNWLGHGLGIALIFHEQTNKTYIATCNRGDKTLSVFLANEEAEQLSHETGHSIGAIIYELDGKLSEEFFSDFGAYFLGPEQLQAAIKKHLVLAKPLIILPAGPQTHENCTYANPKRTIEAILFILMLLQQAPLNKATMDAAYQSYKEFSFFDKNDACETLVNFKRNYSAQKGAQIDAIRAIDQLMAKIVITHHDEKENKCELIYLRKIYLALPHEMQEKLSKILPNEITSLNIDSGFPHRLFARDRKNKRKIRIVGANHDVLNHVDLLSEILRKTKKFSRIDIPRIEVEDKYLFIHLKNPVIALGVIDSLCAVTARENIGNIQEDIIVVKTVNHIDYISEDDLVSAIKSSTLTGKDDEQLKLELKMTKQEAEELVNSNSSPVIRRSEDMNAMPNFLILTFYGPIRRRAVHLQFECEQHTPGFVSIKNTGYLQEIYQRYNPQPVKQVEVIW